MFFFGIVGKVTHNICFVTVIEKTIFFLLFTSITFCNSSSQEKNVNKTNSTNISTSISECYEIKRDKIKEKLFNKINNSKALFVHILVPLFDNNQGIIPTGKSLGNGLNLKTKKSCKNLQLFKIYLFF